MNLNDLAHITPLKYETIKKQEVNPLEVLIRDEFNRQNMKGDYRVRALDRVIGLKLDFVTEHNSVFDFVQMFVNITCPNCKGKTKVVGGGASSHTHSIDFQCENHSCDTKVTLSLYSDGLSVRFKESK